jgi:hypothetical protein
MEKQRSILNNVGLAQEFWAEAIDTTTYLVNRSPLAVLVESTPHDVWFGKKPLLSHLIVFGCDTCVHVPKEKVGQ